VVLPSRGEGLPRSLVEAMAAGVAVVGTDVGGIAELLEGDAGVLVPVGDVAALAAALERLLIDLPYRQAAAARGRERARRYDATAMCRGVDTVYRNVLADR
jgi:glycosyltransferase involved in cell wall biosynthesis